MLHLLYKKTAFYQLLFTYLLMNIYLSTYFTNRINSRLDLNFCKGCMTMKLTLPILFATYHHQEIYLSIVMAFPIIFGGFGCQCQSSSFLAKLFFSTMCYKIFYVNCVCLLSACCYIQSSL